MTPVALFELVLALLLAALLLSSVACRFSLPPAVALVFGGMVLAVTPGVPSLSLDPDLILVLFLPPLLLNSAYNTAWRDFRAAMVPILLLAVGAVAFTTLCVGFAVHRVAPSLPLAACFTLGAIVSPPDAVAATAVLQRLQLPRRLLTILEGESLVNDASGIVLFRLAVAATLTGHFDASQAVGSFAWLTIGGIAIGLVASLVLVAAVRRLRNDDLAIALTFIATWGVYILAERLGASGVLAVVASGITFGLRQHEMLNARTRTRAGSVWGFTIYLLEAFVFVLIGLALRGVLDRGEGNVLRQALPMALVAVGVVVIARLAWVMLASHMAFFLPVRWRERRVAPSLLLPLTVGWAGMRGVVTLAVALALPGDFPARDALLVAAFAVILFTVLVQGTTLGPLVRALRLERFTEAGDEMNEPAARAAALAASVAAIEAMVGPDGILHPQLLAEYQMRARVSVRLRDDPDAIAQRRFEHFTAALAANAAARAELLRLFRIGQIHESVLTLLEEELDMDELRLRRVGKLMDEPPPPLLPQRFRQGIPEGGRPTPPDGAEGALALKGAE